METSALTGPHGDTEKLELLFLNLGFKVLFFFGGMVSFTDNELDGCLLLCPLTSVDHYSVLLFRLCSKLVKKNKKTKEQFHPPSDGSFTKTSRFILLCFAQNQVGFLDAKV